MIFLIFQILACSEQLHSFVQQEAQDPLRIPQEVQHFSHLWESQDKNLIRVARLNIV
jgi:hypothetical protein